MKIPTPDLGCEAYGGGSPLADPEALLRIEDVTVAGGDSPEATLVISYAQSTANAGVAGRFSTDGLIASVAGAVGIATSNTAFNAARRSGDVVVFATLYDLLSATSLPAGDHEVLAIAVCLTPGLAAGAYPLTLTEGELVDHQTGRRIDPQLVSGTLTLEFDVSDEAVCSTAPPEPPEPEEPDDVTASMQLGHAAGNSGDTQSIAVRVGADVPWKATLLPSISTRPSSRRLPLQTLAGRRCFSLNLTMTTTKSAAHPEPKAM